ncbi:hypothetical protein TNCV_600281 [Trichonephila clavipes]|nr:hypothetical protein TNCV_600281 [Trichonephila clavipes]
MMNFMDLDLTFTDQVVLAARHHLIYGPGVADHWRKAPIEAPESLLVVRYELPSVCLENPIHARWDLDPEIMPANPYVQYPHSLRAVRQLLCDDMVHCRP